MCNTFLKTQIFILPICVKLKDYDFYIRKSKTMIFILGYNCKPQNYDFYISSYV